MEIFQQEIDDGLHDAMASDNTVAFCTSPTIITQDKLTQTDIDLILAQAAEETKLKDMAFLTAILASTGWNNNDDVFDGLEMWMARNTPVYKKLDYNHDEGDVIGTIVSTYAVDSNGDKISDDLDVNNLPPNFHIITKAALWTFWKDKKRAERMSNLVAAIAEGKWFVSMEAIFKHFDYAIIKPDGTHATLARTKDTAFLTKHLRRYKGTGEYQGHKVGRLLRNFVFSGKGIVEKPANPKSFILSLANMVEFNSPTKLNSDDFAKTCVYMNDANERERIMSENNDALVNSLQLQLAEANKKIAALETTAQEYDKVRFDTIKAELETAKASTDEQINKLTTAEKAIAELQNQLKAAEAAKAEAIQAKCDMEKKAKMDEKKAALVKAGLTEEEAVIKAEAYLNIDEKVFTDMVEALAAKHKAENALAASVTATVVTPTAEETAASVLETTETPAETVVHATEASAEDKQVEVTKKVKSVLSRYVQIIKQDDGE